MKTAPRKSWMAALVAIFCISLAVMPVLADAATKKKHKSNTVGVQIKNLNKKINTDRRTVRGVSNHLSSISKALGSQLSAVTSGLTSTDSSQKATAAQLAAFLAAAAPIPGALQQLANGLTAIQTALQDPTTGLVGLNTARPLIGGATCDGANVCTAASGSEFSIVAQTATCPAIGVPCYVLRFNRLGSNVNVSSRVVEVTRASTNAALNGTNIPGAVNCSSATAAPLCGAVVGSADSNGTDELVSGAFTSNGFQVAAIAG